MPVSLTTLISIFLTQPSVDGYDIMSEMRSRLMLPSLHLADSVVTSLVRNWYLGELEANHWASESGCTESCGAEADARGGGNAWARVFASPPCHPHLHSNSALLAQAGL